MSLKNSELVGSVAVSLSATPAHVFPARDDSEFVVFRFTNPDDAEAFAEHFGGEWLPRGRWR